MAEFLVVIETYQTLIYLGLVIVALLYLRSTVRWLAERRKARFGLEVERATAGVRRSLAMLVLVGLGMVATFVAANFVGPAMPFSARPTVLPTVSLLSTPEATPTSGTQVAGATALPAGTPDASGCANPNATLTSPEAGESLSGVVEIEGTASITNFAFYKYEFREANNPEASWQAISAGTTPVEEGELGTWDTSLVPAGDYAFRLVVTDANGNAPLPCEIQIRIVPSS